MTGAGAPRRDVPLQVKLVATMVALLAAGLVVTGVTASASLHTYLLDRVDSTLNDPNRVDDLLRHSGRGHGPPDRVSSAGDYYTAVLAADGTPLYVAYNAGSAASLPRLPALTAEDVVRRSGHPFTVRSADGATPWRVQISSVAAGGGAGGTAVVAIGLADVQSTEHRLAQIELLVGAVVLVALAVLGRSLVRRSLRPLSEVEHTAGVIAAGDLSRRVPELDPRTEVGRLSQALNGMLGHIETAFAAQQSSEAAARASEDRMRRFVADASHELRTPLTSIRGFAELYRIGAVASREDLDRNMGRVEAEAARMGALVEDLLLLARLDQQRPLERRPVDVGELAADAVHDLRAVARDRVVTLEAADGAVVTGDEARLRQVLANLLSNALVHTPPATPIAVRVTVDPSAVRLEVADTGPGMTAEQSARVFERFYRVDAARTRAHGGAGLGLSIVAGIVAAHGGEATVRSAPGEGAAFLVTLPRAQGSAGNGHTSGGSPAT